jgi:hypothetical protein
MEHRPPAPFTRVTPSLSRGGRSVFLEQPHLARLCRLLMVPSSQDGAVPVRRSAPGASRRGLGGFAEVPEEPCDVLRLGDEGEKAHAAAAAGAGLDVQAEGSAEQLCPCQVTRGGSLLWLAAKPIASARYSRNAPSRSSHHIRKLLSARPRATHERSASGGAHSTLCERRLRCPVAPRARRETIPMPDPIPPAAFRPPSGSARSVKGHSGVATPSTSPPERLRSSRRSRRAR